MAMSTESSVPTTARWQPQSRRLLDRSHDIRSRLDLEKLDQCSETTLGLITVGVLTALVWILCMPFFDLAGLNWVRRWEGIQPVTNGPPIALWDFVGRVMDGHDSRHAAFDALDHDKDGFVDYTELVEGGKHFGNPLTRPQAKYAFDLVDETRDYLINFREFNEMLNYPDFEHVMLNQTSTTTTTVGPVGTTAPGLQNDPIVSMEELKQRLPEGDANSARKAFAFLDSNSDEYVDRSELRTSGLVPQLSAWQAERVFDRLDTNNDGRIESLEFFRAFQAGIFLRPADMETELLTVKEYQARMGSNHLHAYVTVTITSQNYYNLMPGIIPEIKRVVVADLANVAEVAPSEVVDLDKVAASVTVFKEGRDKIIAECVMTLPQHETTDDVLAVLDAKPTSRLIAEDIQKALPDQSFDRDDVVSMAEVKATRIFKSSDQDNNKYLSQEEFYRAGNKFLPPLTAAEAAYAFKGLDLNHDGQLSPEEYMGPGLDTLGGTATTTTAAPTTTTVTSTTLPPTTTTVTTTTITTTTKVHLSIEDYRNRMGATSLQAAVKVTLNSKSYFDAMPGVSGDVATSVVADLAELTGVTVTDISDLDQKQATATVLQEDTDQVVVKCLMTLPHNEATGDVLAVIDAAPTSNRIADHLLKAHPDKDIEHSDVTSVAEVQPPTVFSEADSDYDKMLTKDEFAKSGEKFNPPLSRAEADFAFEGLDQNKDGKLSPEEFFGPGLKSLDAAEQSQEPPMSMGELKQILGDASESFQEVFVACDANSDAILQQNEFEECAADFRPPLTKIEADYSFSGLDSDKNNEVSQMEFFYVLSSGKFSPGKVEGTTDGQPPITMLEFKKRLQDHSAATPRRRRLEDEALSAFLKLDRNGDGSIAKSEFYEETGLFNPPLNEKQRDFAFSWLDVDGDGYVSMQEFADQYRDGKVKVQPPIALLKDVFGTATQAFDAMDANFNGIVDHYEFVEGCIKKGIHALQAGLMFQTLDLDGDHHLSKYELAQALADHGAQMSEERMLVPARKMEQPPLMNLMSFEERFADLTPQTIFLKLDRDADGFVELEDLTSHTAGLFLHPSLNEEEAGVVFKGLDVNRDSSVGVAEFFGTIRVGHFGATEDELKARGIMIKSKPGSSPAAPAEESEPEPVSAPLKPPITAYEYVARMNRGSAEDIFAEMDINQDGIVNSREYISNAANLFDPPLEEGEVFYTFKGLDADSDDKITPTEFFGVIKLWHFFQTPQALKAAESMTFPLEAPMLSLNPTTKAPVTTTMHLRATTTTLRATQPPATQPEDWEPPITLEGFVEKVKGSHNSPDASFKAMDENGDKKLSFKEFVRGVKSLDEPLDDTEAMYAYKGFDSDEDLLISNVEYTGVLSIGHFFQSPEATEIAYKKLWDQLHPYQCNMEDKDWEFGWSDAKKAWCCEHDKQFMPRCNKDLSEEALRAATLTVSDFLKRLDVSSKSIMNIFNDLDIDKDGYLSLSSLQRQANKFHPPLSETEVEVAFAGFDSDIDGRVQLSEFTQALQRGHFFSSVSAQAEPSLSEWKAVQQPLTLNVFLKRMHSKEPLEVFNKMDNDWDHHLTRDEFMPGVQNFPDRLAEDEAQYAFEGFDVNGDDEVSEAEYVGVLKVGRFYPSQALLYKAGVHLDSNQQATFLKNLLPTTTTTPATTTKEPHFPTTTLSEMPKPTTTEIPFELLNTPLTLADFASGMGSTLPPPLSILATAEGGCVKLPEFVAAGKSFSPPLTEEQANYAFCGMDENHDKQVCSFEFFAVLKIGHFFPSRPHMEHLREVGVLKERSGEPIHLTEAGKKDKPAATRLEDPIMAQPGTPLTSSSMDQYLGVPASINGRAAIAMHLVREAREPGPEVSDAIALAFARTMEKELDLSVEIDGATALQANYMRSAGFTAHDRTVEIMWSAGSVQDGGLLQDKLQQHSLRVERAIQKAVADLNYDWLDRTVVWVKATLSYYGARATTLPQGQQISKEIGRKPGELSEDDQPAYVAKK